MYEGPFLGMLHLCMSLYMYKKALQDQAKAPPTSRLQDGMSNLHKRTCWLTLSQVSLIDWGTTINRQLGLILEGKISVKNSV